MSARVSIGSDVILKRIYGAVRLMPASPMSEEFHDWLDQCPVHWFRGEVNKYNVTYIFETPEEEEEY